MFFLVFTTHCFLFTIITNTLTNVSLTTVTELSVNILDTFETETNRTHWHDRLVNKSHKVQYKIDGRFCVNDTL